MAISVHCDVVSAEESIFSGTVEFGVFPGEAGELGILPNHTPLLTRIKPGTVRLKVQGQSDFELVYVSGGMLEVQPGMITRGVRELRTCRLPARRAGQSRRGAGAG